MQRLPIRKLLLVLSIIAGPVWSAIAVKAHPVSASFGAIRRHAGWRLSWSLFLAFGVCFASGALGQTAHFSGAQSSIGSGMGSPYGIAVDISGDIYVNDYNNKRVLIETPSQGGYTQTVVLDYSSSGIVAPFGIAVDASGNLYMTDEYNGASGTGEVFKETLSAGAYTQSVVASGLYQPNGVAVDGSGNVYIADSHNSRVLKETPSAGSYTQSIVASGLNYPSGVAVDGSGNVYITDFHSNELLKETLAAGSYTQSVVLSTGLNAPSAVAVDGSGNLYIANTSDQDVLKETLAAGSYTLSTVPATGLNRPSGVAVDAVGNIFIPDSGNNRLIELAQFLGNFGPVNVASTSPAPIPEIFTFETVGTLGSISVVTQGKTGLDFSNAIGGSCATGTVYSAGETCTVDVNFKPTLPGTRYGAAVLHNSSGSVIATGYVQGTGVGPQIAYGSTWQVISPTAPGVPVSFFGKAEDGAGNLYSVSGNTVVETLAGGGAPITIDPTVNGTGLNGPDGLAVDGAGDLFIADSSNGRVVKVPAAGGAATAITGFVGPQGIAVDGAGDLFVADPSFAAFNVFCCVLEVPAGSSTATFIYSSDAALPQDVAVDGLGNIFIPNYGYDGPGDLIEIPPGGAPIFYPLPLPWIYGWAIPTAVAVDELGDLFVEDSFNGYLLELARSQPPALSSYTDNPQTLQILNIGNASLTFPIPSAGDNPGISGNLTLNSGEASACPLGTSSSSQPGTLAAGSSCLLSISLTPGTSNTGGALTLTDTNLNAGPPNYSTQTFQISAAGQTPVMPSPGDLGTVNVGSTSSTPASSTLTIAAAGTVGSIAVVTLGTKGLDFSNAGGGTCKIGSAYNAGNTCTVKVTFKPKFAGARYGAVVLYNGSGSVIATGFVQGIGVGAQAAFGSGAPVVISPVANGEGLAAPYSTAVDGAGDLFIVDQGNNRVVEVPAGGGAATAISPTVNGTALSGPNGVAVDGAGNLFIADYLNNRVVEVPTGGGAATAISLTVTPYGQPFGSYNGNGINGVVVDGTGNLYIADCAGGFSVGGLVEVTAGDAEAAIVPPEYGMAALCPYGAAVDAAGDLFITDDSNNVVVEVPAGGGLATTFGPTVNGVGLKSPYDVAVDAAGDLFIADTGNNRVVEVPADGGATVAISPTVNGVGLNGPSGVAVDAAGDLFITDSLNNRVLEFQRSQPSALTFATTQAGSTSADSPQTVQVQNIGNAPLTFPIPSTGDNPSLSANFTLTSGGTSDCPLVASGSSEPGTLAVGSDCLLPISFTPTTAGIISGALKFTDTNLNAASPRYAIQTIQLNGTGTGSPAVLTEPTSGSVLGTTNVFFSWTAGAGATRYRLFLSTYAGAADLFESPVLTTSSITVPTLPSSGATVYATLFSEVNRVWISTTSTYTESPGAPATILLPASGTVLGTSNIPFSWTTGTGVALYELYLGNSPGSADLFRSTRLATTSVTVPSLPSSRATVYATLWSEINGVRQSTTATFTESPGAPATILLPAFGSVLGISNITFSWTSGTGVSLYELYLGNSPGSADFFRSTRLATTSVTVPSLPSSGATVYATLWSEINGVRQSTTATYTEQH